MKNYIFLIIFFLTVCFQFSVAQSSGLFERKIESDEYHSNIYKIISADSGSWIINGYIGICEYGFVSRIDSNGSILWQTWVGRYSDLSFTKDGNFLTVGCNLFQDDVVGESEESIHINKYNTEGDLIFEAFDTTDLLWDCNLKIAELTSGLIYVSNQSDLRLYSETGDSLWVGQFNFGEFNVIHANNNNQLLAGTDNNLILIDSVGNVILSIPFNAVSQIEAFTDSNYLVVSNTNIIILSKNLGIETTLNLSNTFQFISDVSVSDNVLFVLGQDNNSPGTLLNIYDKQSSLLLNSKKVGQGSIEPNSIASTTENIAIGGIDKFAAAGHGFVKTFDYNLNTYESIYDLEISNLKMDSFDKELEMLVPGYDFIGDVDSVFDYTYYLSFEVNNVGNNMVDSFYIQSGRIAGINCSNYNIREKVIDTIMPGETILVNTSFSQRINGHYNSICLDVISPNDEFDIDKSNNRSCKDLITRINESKEIYGIELFPNPFNDYLILNNQSGKSLEQLSIFDLSGNMVMDMNVVNEGQNKIQTSNLSSGVYFLKVSSGNQNFVEKLIKVNR